MSTFARIFDGFAVDIQVAETRADLASRFNLEWLSRNPFIVVPDDTRHGRSVTVNQDGSLSCGENPPLPDLTPKPNNPGNPYFGKKPLPTKDFYALAWQALGTAKFNRLVTDSGFIWIDKVLSQIELVDPDDKAGQFLQIVAYLTTTNASDSQKMMSAQDVSAIMSAWP